MTYYARCTHVRSGTVSRVRAESRSVAARRAVIMLRLGGWDGDDTDAERRLFDGQTLSYGGFVYDIQLGD